MDEDAAHARIRRGAQETLEVWPEARAAVLFGSRARGDHRPSSDRDVAFIVKGDGERPGTVPDGFAVQAPEHRSMRERGRDIGAACRARSALHRACGPWRHARR